MIRKIFTAVFKSFLGQGRIAAGAALGLMPFYASGANVIADSVADFSGVQGKNGWYYGYYEGPFSPSGFRLMTSFKTSVQNPLGFWSVNFEPPAPYFWTLIGPESTHPNGLVTSGGRATVEHWSVRRWISTVDGVVNFSGVVGHNGSPNSNGIVARIFANDAPIYSRQIESSNTGGFGFSLQQAVSRGQVVDFAIDPFHANDLGDTTFFKVVMTPLSIPGLGGVGANYEFRGVYDSGANSVNKVEAESLTIKRGSQFSLGPMEEIVLTDGSGVLSVEEGAVFTGNGTLRGSISNRGLVRIPIKALESVKGGEVQIITPTPPAPPKLYQPLAAVTVIATAPVIINRSTYVRLIPGGGGSGGGSGSGSGSGESAGITNPQVIVLSEASPVVQGALAVDASLKVTGTFTQEDTGMLRLFVAGNTQADLSGPSQSGGTYSQLFVGETVSLNGAFQVVLQPELFAIFNYTPKVGDTFDFVISDQRITLASGLVFSAFVTDEGKSKFFAGVGGLSFMGYNSGLAGDPDKLWQINETVFSFELINDEKILRATLVNPLLMATAVPEPETYLMWLLGVLFVATRVFQRKGRYSMSDASLNGV